MEGQRTIQSLKELHAEVIIDCYHDVVFASFNVYGTQIETQDKSFLPPCLPSSLSPLPALLIFLPSFPSFSHCGCNPRPPTCQASALPLSHSTLQMHNPPNTSEIQYLAHFDQKNILQPLWLVKLSGSEQFSTLILLVPDLHFCAF